MPAACIYTRISADRTGDALGVARQEADCRALADRLGYTVEAHHVFQDNDLSASTGKPRPAYDALIAAVEAGEVTAVIAYHPDRLTRRMAQLVALVDFVKRTGVKVHTVAGGDYDLNTATGRQVAYTIGAAASAEAERAAERIQRKHQELREAGAWAGGGKRTYGWVYGRTAVIPAEREVLREAARRVLAGETVGAVCRDLDRRKVPTATAKPGTAWTTRTLRGMLTSEAIAGLRAGRPAQWEALVDAATWSRLQRHFANPQRAQGGRPHEYLLTGGRHIIFCERCGTAMSSRRTKGRRAYACRGERYTGRKGCGRMHIGADSLHDYIEVMVLGGVDRQLAFEAKYNTRIELPFREYEVDGSTYRVFGLVDIWALASERVARADTELDAILTELDAIQAQREELGAALAQGAVSLATATAAEAGWTARAEALEARSAALAQSGNGAAILDEAAKAADDKSRLWQDRSVGWRRGLVASVIDRIVIGPPVKWSTFDLERVTLVAKDH